jgi:hypothetical protein
MNINLHIERLVLDGINITPAQGRLLQASLASQLSQLLMDGGLSASLSQGAVLPKLPASDIQLTDNNPAQLGQQIAQSVYRGIGHE